MSTIPGKAMKSLLMEINIPFCYHRCSFCAQPVIIDASAKDKDAYAQALIKEVEANAAEYPDYSIAALHISDGLASSVPAPALEKLIQSIKKNYDTSHMEISLRAFPGNISADHLTYYRRAGITRFELEALSMDGMDSMALGCMDIRDILPYTIKMLHMNRYRSIGVRVAYGSKDQKLADWRRSLLSFLSMSLTEYTFTRCMNQLAAEAEKVAEQLGLARKLLSERGFIEYIPLHFALPGYEDPYSILDDQGSEKIAFGLNACSRIDGAEIINTSDMQTYLSHSDDFRQITVSIQPI